MNVKSDTFLKVVDASRIRRMRSVVAQPHKGLLGEPPQSSTEK
jgi:hypothetical protein